MSMRSEDDRDCVVVLGAQFGDEGKGKLIDVLLHSSSFALCARANGGDNAGHTIKANGQTYDVHIIPSGVISKTTNNLIGSGCVVNIHNFFSEIEQLESKGLDLKGRIQISSRAHVLFELFKAVDGLQEVELGKSAIGTTKRGIGPCYAAKAARSGVRVGDVFDKDYMETRVRRMADDAAKRFGDLLKYDLDAELKQFDKYREELRPYVCDQLDVIQASKNILCEGAQSLALDIDHGTFPMVTSSNCGIGGICSGLGLSPFRVKRIIGVVKTYMTRVGSGPFPTEIDDENGKKLQEIGGEWGVSTGRRRRCGWLDLVLLRYSTAINDYTSLNLTKLDVLDTFPEISVCVDYKIKGNVIPGFPSSARRLAKCEPVYKTFQGWQTPTTSIKKYKDLPENARKYVEFIEENLQRKVEYIGIGSKREDLIIR